MEQELTLLNEVAHLTCQEMQDAVNSTVTLPRFASFCMDFPKAYHERTANVRKTGWGMYAKHTMFYLLDGKITPACPADTTTLDVLSGYTDRQGDDIHLQNTIQETLSLSDRFGLSIYFSTPGKALYLQIVHDLARQKGIALQEQDLDFLAERFAREKGGRSPRTAEQFTDHLLAAAVK